jgi:hypothetical protein
VEQGIERKYLIPPLGEDEETKKRRQQEAADAAKRELNEVMAKKKKTEKSGQEDDKQREFSLWGRDEDILGRTGFFFICTVSLKGGGSVLHERVREGSGSREPGLGGCRVR